MLLAVYFFYAGRETAKGHSKQWAENTLGFYTNAMSVQGGTGTMPEIKLTGDPVIDARSKLPPDWNIKSRAHACEACGKSFADKETYHTLLFDEKASFRRTDICQACWQKQYSEDGRDRKGFVSHWQGVYEAPPPPTDQIQKETAESLLRKLIELKDPKYIPAGYILAVMLERKRLLNVKEQLVRDGQRVIIYEQPKTGDIFIISDPRLQLNQLEAVRQDVRSLLEHGLQSSGQPRLQVR